MKIISEAIIKATDSVLLPPKGTVLTTENKQTGLKENWLVESAEIDEKTNTIKIQLFMDKL